MSASTQRPIVVYDGECQFCRRQTERIRRYDRHDRLECVPRQTPWLTDRFPELADDDFNTGMRLIMPDGRIYVGADSVHQIVRQLPVLSWFAWLYRVPGLHALARVGYAWVAARRLSLGRSCDEQACALPVPPDRSSSRQ